MEQEIVNFEQAKALKKLGFPQEDESYNEYTYIYLDNAVNLQDNHKCIKELMQIKDFYNGAFDSWDMYVAPTLELAAKWLRDIEKLSITISWMPNIKKYSCICGDMNYIPKEHSYSESYKMYNEKFTVVKNGNSRFNSYEEALSAGIDKAIEILTKEE